jgi:hypothetical protein
MTTLCANPVGSVGSRRSLKEYAFVDAQGAVIPHEQIVVESCIKAEPGQPRQSYRVDWLGRPALMKVRQLPDFRGKLRALLGQAYLRREHRFLDAAAQRRLPVARCLGHGWRRRYGLVVEQVLFVEWLDGFEVLSDAVRASIERGDRAGVRGPLLGALTGLAAAIRGAGLADKDFGAHNILVRQGAERAPADYRWIDLERCVLATDDPLLSAEMIGSALASWWVATNGSIDELLFAWGKLRSQTDHSHLPAHRLSTRTEREMRAKVAKLVSRRWIDCCPPAGILEAA